MLVSVTLPVEHKPFIFYSRPTVVSVAWTCFQVSVLVDILTRGYPGLPHQFEESETDGFRLKFEFPTKISLKSKSTSAKPLMRLFFSDHVVVEGARSAEPVG